MTVENEWHGFDRVWHKHIHPNLDDQTCLMCQVEMMDKENDLKENRLRDMEKESIQQHEQIVNLQEAKGIKCKYHGSTLLYCPRCVNVIYAKGWRKENAKLKAQAAHDRIENEKLKAALHNIQHINEKHVNDKEIANEIR